MTTIIRIIIVVAVIGIVVNLLLNAPQFPSEAGAALGWAFSQAKRMEPVFPVLRLLVIITLMLGIEAGLMIIRHVTGIGAAAAGHGRPAGRGEE